MSTLPKIWCKWDRCHEIVPGSHNAQYCPPHDKDCPPDCKEHCGCKRKVENSKRQLSIPIIPDAERWQLQESRKLAIAEDAQAKNQWLLETKSFGFFDIESSNLSASIGMHLCACIKPKGTDKILTASTLDAAPICSHCDHPGEYLNDHKMAVQLRDWLEQFDYVVTFYGTRFDVPYLNTRLIMYGERPINQMRHVDLYYVARTHLRLHSNRLEVVAQTVLGRSAKTHIVGPIWLRAVQGDPEAMGYIVDHCERDVVELERAFDRLRGFINLSKARVKKYGGTY